MWQVSYRSHYSEFTLKEYSNAEAYDSEVTGNGTLVVRGDRGVIAVYAKGAWHDFQKYGDDR